MDVDELQKQHHYFSENKDQRTRLQVFLCYASNDIDAVQELYERLGKEDLELSVWMDRESLYGGQNWRQEIDKAVSEADIVIICLSTSSLNKEGYVHKEIQRALEIASTKPDGTIFIVPLKLERCNVPVSLEDLHYIKYYEDTGYERLMKVLRAKAKTLQKVVEKSFKEDNKDASYALSLNDLKRLVIPIQSLTFEEFRTLCFDLEVDYDNLPGEEQSEKELELIAYMQREKRLAELENTLSKAQQSHNDNIKRINEQVNELFAKANQARTKKPKADWDEAIRLGEEILKLKKDYHPARTSLARDYYWRGNNFYFRKLYSNAINDFNHAIELDKDQVDYHRRRGEAFYHEKEYEKAIQDYNDAITLNPTRANYYYLRGLAFLALNALERAKDDFKKSAALGYISAKEELAKLEQPNPIKTDSEEESIVNDSKAAKQDEVAPQPNPETLAMLSQEFFGAQTNSNWSKVIESGKRILEFQPENQFFKREVAKAYRERSKFYAQNHHQDEYISDLTEAIALDPNNADDYVKLGIAYRTIGKYYEAISNFDRAITLIPNRGNHYFARALAYKGLNNLEAAINDLRKARQLGYAGATAELRSLGVNV